MALFVSLIFCASMVFAQSSLYQVTVAERNEEIQYLKILGLNVKSENLIEHPYSQPFSGKSLVVPTSWYWAKPAQVKASDLSADLEILEAVLAKAYGGYEIAELHGWNWARFFSTWKTDLQNYGETLLPISRLVGPWNSFKKFQTDNHTDLIFDHAPGHQGIVPGSQTAALAFLPTGACTELKNHQQESLALTKSDLGQQPKSALVGRSDGSFLHVFYVAYPASFGESSEIICDGKKIPLTNAWHFKDAVQLGDWLMNPDSEKGIIVRGLADPKFQLDPYVAYKYPTYRDISSQIGYLRIPSLSEKINLQKMNQNLSIPFDVDQKELLIVDLRVNGGGFFNETVKAFFDRIKSISALADLSRDLIEGSDTQSAFPLVRKNSCLDQALNWGSNQIGLNQTSKLSPEQITHNQLILDSIEQGGVGCPSSLSKGKFDWFYRDHKYNPKPGTKLLILVDELCGSDCEGVLFSLAKSQNSVIAGVNSFGVVQFIQPRNFILPRTKIAVQMAIGFSDTFGDNRTVESRGLGVDIYLPTKESQSAGAIIDLAKQILSGKLSFEQQK